MVEDVEWVSVGDVVEYGADEYNAKEMDSCIQELETRQNALGTTQETSDKLPDLGACQ